MLSNTLINDFDDDFNDDFNDYNYIQGKPLNKEELNNLNYLIDFDVKNKTIHEIYFIIQYKTIKIFNDNESIKFKNVKYEIITQGKKKFYKYENDDFLYIEDCQSYNFFKKKLFFYLENLLILLNNKIEQDIKDYINIKYFNNINKCNFNKCLSFYIYLFIYWINSINNPNLKRINYKTFKKYIYKFHNKKTFYDIIKNILIVFKNIEYNFKFYEELKEHINYNLFKITQHFYLLIK